MDQAHYENPDVGRSQLSKGKSVGTSVAPTMAEETMDIREFLEEGINYYNVDINKDINEIEEEMADEDQIEDMEGCIDGKKPKSRRTILKKFCQWKGGKLWY